MSFAKTENPEKNPFALPLSLVSESVYPSLLHKRATNYVKYLNTIKFKSILKFIIHLCTIYINPMFTVYLIKVVWVFWVEMLVFALTLIKCSWVAKYEINSFTKKYTNQVVFRKQILQIMKLPSKSVLNLKKIVEICFQMQILMFNISRLFLIFQPSYVTILRTQIFFNSPSKISNHQNNEIKSKTDLVF